MRGLTLLSIMLALVLAAPVAAVAQTPAPTGGASYDENAPDPSKPVVEGTKAVRLDDGRAAAPSMAPPEIQKAIWAANEIVGRPYSYGGGHNRSFKSTGYDCSGTVSYALHGGGLLKSPLDSGSFMSWGKAHKGTWVTVYANSTHVIMKIGDQFYGTSGFGHPESGGGPGWFSVEPSPDYLAGFAVRHPAGL